MSKTDELILIQGFLAAPPGPATPEQILAWEGLFRQD
jgi:hypothetical protein